jgi:hypothetical protein
MKSRTPGRFLAWTALLVALGANVASAQPAWEPRVANGVPPLLTALAVALIERVPLDRSRPWQRSVIWVALGLIALFSFIPSYDHQYELLSGLQNSAAVSRAVLPLAVDGLIVMSSVCLSVIADRNRVEVQPAPVAPEVGVEVVPAVELDDATQETSKVAPNLDAQPRPARSKSGSRRRAGRRTSRAPRLSRAEREAALVRLVEQDPEITNAALAAELGVTTEWARVLRKSNGSQPQPA